MNAEAKIAIHGTAGTEAKPAASGPLPLKTWLWRSYIRAALVPLLLIELTFVGLYWGTSRVVYDRSAEAVRRISTEALRDAAAREGTVITRRLETITALTRVYADETRADEKPSYNQVVSQRISNDGGRTWSAAATIAEQPGGGRLRPGRWSARC